MRKEGARSGGEYFRILFREVGGPCATGLITGLLERGGEPFEAFVEAVTGGGTGRLDILGQSVRDLNQGMQWWTYPSTLSEAVETELVRDFGCIHGILWWMQLATAHSDVLNLLLTGRSCLLAKTRSSAFLNSSSFSMRCNSSRASTIRSRSLLSTTKMMPWVFWK